MHPVAAVTGRLQADPHQVGQQGQGRRPTQVEEEGGGSAAAGRERWSVRARGVHSRRSFVFLTFAQRPETWTLHWATALQPENQRFC